MHDWAPELTNAIDKTEGDVAWRNLYQLPVGFTWPHKSGVTLLGDAAHLMTPFAGIGVNTAFNDAILLSREIVAFANGQGGSLDEHIKTYEEKMFAFAHKGMKQTDDCKTELLLTPGAPRTTIQSFVARQVSRTGPVVGSSVGHSYSVHRVLDV